MYFNNVLSSTRQSAWPGMPAVRCVDEMTQLFEVIKYKYIVSLLAVPSFPPDTMMIPSMYRHAGLKSLMGKGFSRVQEFCCMSYLSTESRELPTVLRPHNTYINWTPSLTAQENVFFFLNQIEYLPFINILLSVFYL